MKNYRQQLDTLFHKAQASSAGDRLLSQDEIRNLLGKGASLQPISNTNKGIRPMVLASAATGLATLITAGTILFTGGSTNTPQQVSAEQQNLPTEQRPDIQMAKPTTAQPVEATEINRNTNRNPQPSAAVDIQNIKMLELSNDELLALGIERKDGGAVTVYEKNKNGEVTYMTYSTKGTTINPTAVSTRTFPFFGAEALRMITDDRGAQRMTSYKDTKPAKTKITTTNVTSTVFLPNNNDINLSTVVEVYGKGKNKTTKERPATPEEIRVFQEGDTKQQEFDKNVSTLIRASRWIAISLPTGIAYTEQDSLNKRWRPDLILWFEPTPELIAHLPERYRSTIEQEVHLADISNEASSKPVQNPNDAYLDLWRTRAGAITNSMMMPNPAPASEQYAKIHYTLGQPRTISINLRDLTGSVLRQVAKTQARSTGEWQEEVSLGTLTPGMYLITIETDRGEYAVQRLIVE